MESTEVERGRCAGFVSNRESRSYSKLEKDRTGSERQVQNAQHVQNAE